MPRHEINYEEPSQRRPNHDCDSPDFSHLLSVKAKEVSINLNMSANRFTKLLRSILPGCCHHRPARSPRLLVTARLPGGTVSFIAGEHIVETRITSINNEVPFTLDPVDFLGHETQIDGPIAFNVNDPGTAVVPDPDFHPPADRPRMQGFIARAVDPGSENGLNIETTIEASLDADLGEGVRTLTIGVLSVTWLPREAEAISVSVGDARPRT